MGAVTPLRRAAPLALGLAALATACIQDSAGLRFRLAVEPDTLVFTARQGGLPHVERYLTVSGTGPLSWTAEADVPWLSLSPTSGGILQGVLVVANQQGLPLGTHDGIVSFVAPGASNSPVRAVVRLDVVAQTPLAGRWLGAWSGVVLSLDLREAAGAVSGSGLVAVGATPFTVLGTRWGDNIALTLQPASGAPIALNAFFASDHVMRGSLTGPGFPGDSVLLFRQ